MEKRAINIRALQALGLLSIIILIAIFYYPSLSHLPRSDHWAFLVDTYDTDTVLGTFKKTYSYNRQRLMAPGDTGLFRPLLFLVLSIEKGVFGNNFQWIQAMGILFHIIVIFLLFIILNQIRSLFKIKNDPQKDILFNIIGILFIAYYALNFTFTESIIWTHLHGYLVFHIFILLSFILTLKYISLPDDKRVQPGFILFSIWVLTFLSTFIYELGQISSVLFGILFFALSKDKNLTKRSLTTLSFVAIPIIYQYTNYIDLKNHQMLFKTDITAKMILNQALDFATIEHSLRLFGYFVLHPFLPSLAIIRFTSRVAIGELRGNRFGPLVIPSIFVIFAWLSIVFFGTKELLKSKFKQINHFLCFLLFLYLGYFALIVLGRLNMRPGFGVITTSTYYVYYPLCYMTIIILFFAGYLIQSDFFKRFRLAKLVKGSIYIGIPILLSINLKNIYAINSTFKKADAGFKSEISKIEQFVKERPNTKLAFDLQHGDSTMQGHGVATTTALFRKYEDNITPQFVVQLKENFDVHFIPIGFYRKFYNIADNEQIMPTLVKIGTLYHIYFYKGLYYAVLHDGGPFYYSQIFSNSYLISASSIEKVEKKMPGILDKRREAIINAGNFDKHPVLIDPIEKNYRGFTIVRSLELFYATPKVEGKFDFARLKSKDYSKVFSTASLEDIKSFIDAYVLNSTIQK